MRDCWLLVVKPLPLLLQSIGPVQASCDIRVIAVSSPRSCEPCFCNKSTCNCWNSIDVRFYSIQYAFPTGSSKDLLELVVSAAAWKETTCILNLGNVDRQLGPCWA